MSKITNQLNDVLNEIKTEIKAEHYERFQTILRKMDKANEKTLRDEFAMAALTGMLACGDGIDEHFRFAPRDCYEIADIMLKARKG